jgi:hypothetical protein
MSSIFKNIYALISALFIIPLALGFGLMIHTFIYLSKCYDRYIFPLPYLLHSWYYRHFAHRNFSYAQDIIAHNIMRSLNGHHDPEEGVFIFSTRYDYPSEIMDAYRQMNSIRYGFVQDVEDACYEQMEVPARPTAESSSPTYPQLS